MKSLYITVGALALLAACSTPTPQEKTVSSSPDWYLTPPTDDGMIYAAGMSTSSDLQFAVDKALLQAKSGLADRLKGETSVLSRSHATQSGNVVTRADDKTVKNIAKDVQLGGYEMVKSSVLPDAGSYRAYVLLKFVPTASDLDKSTAMLDAAKVTGPGVVVAPPSPTVSVNVGSPVVAVPVAPVVPSSDEPPAPAADPRPTVTKED